jgi:hypothetical protein
MVYNRHKIVKVLKKRRQKKGKEKIKKRKAMTR